MLRAQRAIADVQAVRNFLQQESCLEDDIIEAIISRGASRLDHLASLTMEDLALAPVIEARHLITVVIPQSSAKDRATRSCAPTHRESGC